MSIDFHVQPRHTLYTLGDIFQTINPICNWSVYMWISAHKTQQCRKTVNESVAYMSWSLLCARHYLHQGGYDVVVCLFVSNFAQKLPIGFAWNFLGRLAMGQWTNDYILVAIQITVWIQGLHTGFVTIGRYGKWLTDIHSYWFARWRHW